MDSTNSLIMENSVLPRESFKSLLHPLEVQKLTRQWLSEDSSGLDLASISFPNDIQSSARIIVKEPTPAILCGTPFCQAIFDQLNCKVTWLAVEGSQVVPYQSVGTITGYGRDILLAERVVLNVLSRASGVATVSRRVSQVLKDRNWHGTAAGTRKTTPGFRLVEKYAMLVGGVSTHRYSLSDMIMLKDNHLKLAGSISEAVKLAKSVGSFHQKIEVECSSLEEGFEAAQSGCDIVMFDNFDPDTLKQSAEDLKTHYPNVLIEASGGINESNITDYVSKDVDIVSSSIFVQGYKTIDFSMKII